MLLLILHSTVCKLDSVAIEHFTDGASIQAIET